jgi:hypothetical protein
MSNSLLTGLGLQSPEAIVVEDGGWWYSVSQRGKAKGIELPAVAIAPPTQMGLDRAAPGQPR